MQRSLYTETAFTHRRVYRQKRLHKEAFTQELWHTRAFTHRSCYTQTLLRKEVFTQRALTHRRVYTQKFLHRSLYKESFYTRKLSHTEVFTQRSLYTESFNTQAPLHTEVFTQRSLYTESFNTQAHNWQQFFRKNPSQEPSGISLPHLLQGIFSEAADPHSIAFKPTLRWHRGSSSPAEPTMSVSSKIYIYIYIAQRLGFAQVLQRRGLPFTNKWCCKLP